MRFSCVLSQTRPPDIHLRLATETDAAKKAAELGSNVLRTRINWSEIEPQKGNWDPILTPGVPSDTRLARYRAMCQAARDMRHEGPGSEASDKVWERYNKIRAVAGNRKLWITEVGASSYHLNPGNQIIGMPNNGFARQVGFIEHLMDEASTRHNIQDRPLEGVVLWPMKDDAALDGTAPDWGQWRDAGYYHKNGNIKPAGTTLTNKWNTWN